MSPFLVKEELCGPGSQTSLILYFKPVVLASVKLQCLKDPKYEAFINNGQIQFLMLQVQMDDMEGWKKEKFDTYSGSCIMAVAWICNLCTVVCLVLAVSIPFCLCQYWFTQSHSFSVRIANSDNCSENKQTRFKASVFALFCRF